MRIGVSPKYKYTLFVILKNLFSDRDRPWTRIDHCVYLSSILYMACIRTHAKLVNDEYHLVHICSGPRYGLLQLKQ